MLTFIRQYLPSSLQNDKNSIVARQGKRMLPSKKQRVEKITFVYFPMSSVRPTLPWLTKLLLSLLDISNILSLPLMVILKHMSRRRQRKTRVEKEASQVQQQTRKKEFKRKEDPRLTCFVFALNFFFFCHSSFVSFLLLLHISIVFFTHQHLVSMQCQRPKQQSCILNGEEV